MPSEPPTHFHLRRITEDAYNHAAEVVSPVRWEQHGFLLGEPIAHRACDVSGEFHNTYRGFVCLLDHVGRGVHYELSQPVTIPEWEALDIEALEVGLAFEDTTPAILAVPIRARAHALIDRVIEKLPEPQVGERYTEGFLVNLVAHEAMKLQASDTELHRHFLIEGAGPLLRQFHAENGVPDLSPTA